MDKIIFVMIYYCPSLMGYWFFSSSSNIIGIFWFIVLDLIISFLVQYCLSLSVFECILSICMDKMHFYSFCVTFHYEFYAMPGYILMNSWILCLSWNVFICPSVLRDTFAGISTLVDNSLASDLTCTIARMSCL